MRIDPQYKTADLEVHATRADEDVHATRADLEVHATLCGPGGPSYSPALLFGPQRLHRICSGRSNGLIAYGEQCDNNT